MCRAGRLRGVRFGPFVASPGHRWRSVLSGALTGLLADGDGIVAHAAYPATAAGVALGYPPLHAHHVHVRHADSTRGIPRALNSHWFESHGDYVSGGDGAEPAADRGYGLGAAGAAGYVTRLPRGYCVLVREADEVDVEAEVNDVRGAGAAGAQTTGSASAEPLAWWLQVVFQLAEPAGRGGDACRPASKVWMRYPLSVAVPTADDWWGRYDVPGIGALSWWEGTVGWDGSLLSAWFHSHRNRFDGLLLLASSADSLRFSCADFGITTVRGDYALSSNLSATRAAFASRGRVVCEADARDAPTAVRLRPAAAAAVGVDEKDWFDRRGELRCAPHWHFRRGDAYTVVAFHAPRYGPPGHAKQHTELWMYLDRGPLAPSEVALPDWFGVRANHCPDPIVGDDSVEESGRARPRGDNRPSSTPFWLSLVPPTALLEVQSTRRGGGAHTAAPRWLRGGLAGAAAIAALSAGVAAVRRAQRRGYARINRS